MLLASCILLVILGVTLYASYGMLLSSAVGDTAYATQYSDNSFEAVRLGMSRDDVLSLLGQPIFVQRGHTSWIYTDKRVTFTATTCDPHKEQEVCQVDPPSADLLGMSESCVEERLGKPLRTIETKLPDLEEWHYSYSPSGTHHIRITVGFSRIRGCVKSTFKRPYWD
jgi:hypothetical protein